MAASAVDNTASSFHRSHSTPDFLSQLTKPPPSVSSELQSQHQQQHQHQHQHHHSSTTISTSASNSAGSTAGSPSSATVQAELNRRSLSLKSLPSLPAFDVPSFDFDLDLDAHLVLRTTTKPAERTISVANDRLRPAVHAGSIQQQQPSPMALPKDDKLSRSRSFIERPRSWLPSSRSSPNVRDLLDDEPRASDKSHGADAGASGGDAESKRLTPNDRSASFADFAKRSWISGARSPSPKKDKGGRGRNSEPADDAVRQRSGSTGSAKGLSKFSRKRPVSTLGDAENNRSSDSLSSTSRALKNAGEYLTKIKQRPQTVLIKAGTSTPALAVSEPSPAPPTSDDSALSAKGSALDPSAANNNHNDNTLDPRRLSSQTGASSATDSSSGTHGASSTVSDNSQATADTMPHPTSVDPLWSAFRKLDSDFATFTAKNTTSQRMVVARGTIVPFLRNYANHASNKDKRLLSPEDVDRRATILNKWWNGLLEMLDGSGSRSGATAGLSFASSSAPVSNSSAANLQPVAGVDRPTLLEAMTTIMMRPEWRLCTTYFRPLADRSPRELVRACSDSANSDTSFIAESAEHNVRTMFTNNLLAQMSIVVDKMSSRHAPLSLVNFCGKACAFAFFFVPDVSEIMVRLWDITPDMLRRIADEFGLPRRSAGESDDIVSLFPPNLQKLGWTAVKQMTDSLRQPTKLSLVAARIPWYGPWVSRWRGGDTDLLFIFCKYYHILAEEFMPPGLPLVEKARAPAFVLLHAQLLGILDTTIHHRQAAVEAVMGPPMPDGSHAADAMVTTLPQLPPSNLLRGMEENRMVVLLKDMLAENSIGGVSEAVRKSFSIAFMAILKAVTKRTPVFKQGPVFVLVDFLQEVLSALDTYTGYTDPDVRGRKLAPKRPTDYIEWSFWLDIFQRIMDSSNTMSEIRMLSFVFSNWEIITADPVRKEEVCLGWWLREDVFDKFFNNYSPMVRAYFMRLLCWRICRDEGSANDLDARIFATVSERLKTIWSHYLWLKHKADAQGKLPPSTAPAHPQPGKVFMIIRTEVRSAQPGLMIGFDSFSGSRSAGEPGHGHRAHGSSGSDEGSPNGGGGRTGRKKKWSIIGRVLSFTGSTVPMANAAGMRTVDDDLQAARRETAAMRAAQRPLSPPKGSTSPGSESDASSTGSSPVFDAVQYVFKFTLSTIPWQQAQGIRAPGPVAATPRDRVLTRPRLPYPAQAKVSARAAAAGRRTESPPPPAPGLPPPERRVSGLSQVGLVSEARNARPVEDGRPTVSVRSISDGSLGGGDTPARNATPVHEDRSMNPFGISDPAPQVAQPIQPVQPLGIFRDRAVYSGRALAEWGLIVNECNSFIDRRRDEGVYGLREVEVPTLGVDGLRRMG